LIPSKIQRGYWMIKDSYESVTAHPPVSGEFGFPDEMNSSYETGDSKRVLVNRYERDPKAREACINHFGFECQVCESSMVDLYGDIAREFIHVHHLKPESLRQKGVVINPVVDLIPVCPNCHTMLHMSDPPFEPSELKEIIIGNLQKLAAKAGIDENE
jgi:5-methylcytosine-specific restriction enzyme A